MLDHAFGFQYLKSLIVQLGINVGSNLVFQYLGSITIIELYQKFECVQHFFLSACTTGAQYSSVSRLIKFSRLPSFLDFSLIISFAPVYLSNRLSFRYSALARGVLPLSASYSSDVGSFFL